MLLLSLVEARAAEPAPPAAVRIRDRSVVEIRVPRGERSAERRAREASEELAHALDTPGAERIRIEAEEDGFTILAGPVPILRLGPDDAHAAGSQDPALYAAAVMARIDAAYQAERRRLAIQAMVFAFSLLVFSGLIVAGAVVLIAGHLIWGQKF